MSNEPDLAALARRILDDNVYMTLGTADAAGRPWVSPVYYAHERFADFYWISSPESEHSRNLAVRPELAIVVFDSTVPPGTGQAVYMSALAEQVAEDGIERGLEVYPGPPERGARRIDADELRPPGPYRLYRATVSQHWVLAPGASPDQRTAVELLDA